MDGWMLPLEWILLFPIQSNRVGWMFPSFSRRRVNAPTDGGDRAAAILSCFLNAGSGSVGLNSRSSGSFRVSKEHCVRKID